MASACTESAEKPDKVSVLQNIKLKREDLPNREVVTEGGGSCQVQSGDSASIGDRCWDGGGTIHSKNCSTF